MSREIIYEDYLNVVKKVGTGELSEDAQILLALMDISLIQISIRTASRIKNVVFNEKGEQTRKLSSDERRIFLNHPATLQNRDGSLQFNGVILE